MGSLSLTHWLILVAVAVLLFGGRGRISGLLGDVGKGIRTLREGVVDDGPAALEKRCDSDG